MVAKMGSGTCCFDPTPAGRRKIESYSITLSGAVRPPEADEESVSQGRYRSTTTDRTAAIGRILPVPARSGGGRLNRHQPFPPPRERVFVPHKRPSRGRDRYCAGTRTGSSTTPAGVSSAWLISSIDRPLVSKPSSRTISAA